MRTAKKKYLTIFLKEEGEEGVGNHKSYAVGVHFLGVGEVKICMCEFFPLIDSIIAVSKH